MTWRTVHIGDIATVYDGPHATPKETETGPIFLGISSLNNGRIDLSQSRRISEDDFKRWTRRVTPEPGDIVFSYETRLGQAAMIPEGLRCCLGRRLALLRPDRSKIDPNFLLYKYLSPPFQEFLKARVNPGSTVDRILLREVPEFPIHVPNLNEQRQIANIAASLDNKISINSNMNKTLEAMARAIFKDWFVDFGPVRAKMEGREPYLSREIWDLFPQRFDDEGKPEGWSYRKLGELTRIVSGRSYKSSELIESHNALVTLKSFNRSGGYRSDGLKPYVGPFREEQVVKEGEIVLAKTDVTQNADIVGSPARVVNEQKYAKLIASLDTCVIRPKGSEYIGNEFLLRLLESRDFKLYAVNHTSGTTVLHLSKDSVPDYTFAFPSSGLISAFEEMAAPFADRIIRNMHENRTLSAARDLLLPKLFSGEVSIHDAPCEVEASL